MKRMARNVLGTMAFSLATMCMLSCVDSPCNAQSQTQAQTVAAPSGLVDLTAAAESSVNAVVYIKVTTNSKTKTVDVPDPYSDFFGDFFGFGGDFFRR